MPLHLQDHIKAALLKRATAMVLDPAMPLSVWDRKFDKPKDESGKPLPFIEAKIFTAPTVDLSIGENDENQLTGFLQLNLNWPQDAGEAKPASVVGQIVNYFRRGRQMGSGPIVVEIHKMPKDATPFLQSPYSVTQITVPYQVFSKQF